MVQADELHLRDGDTWAPHAERWGIDDTTANHGMALADLNEDGYVDLIKREWGGRLILHLSRCGNRAWLKVRLHDATNNNPDAIGARVELVRGQHTWTRRLVAGGESLASSGPPELHFGLAEETELDHIEVTWPDGDVVVYPWPEGEGLHRTVVIHRESL